MLPAEFRDVLWNDWNEASTEKAKIRPNATLSRPWLHIFAIFSPTFIYLYLIFFSSFFFFLNSFFFLLFLFSRLLLYISFFKKKKLFFFPQFLFFKFISLIPLSLFLSSLIYVLFFSEFIFFFFPLFFLLSFSLVYFVLWSTSSFQYFTPRIRSFLTMFLDRYLFSLFQW